MMVILKITIVAAYMVAAVKSDCTQLPYPSELLKCFKDVGSESPITEHAGETISSYCIQEYLWVTRRQKWNPDEDVTNFKFIATLARLDSAAPSSTDRVGENGTSLGTPEPRLRKEYRRLTGRERRRFHKALRKMKKDKSAFPNAYDFLADIHTGNQLGRAHGGAAFLGWHRVYLYLFENAMRRHIPDATLPYWDSSLDFYLSSPERSVIFSKTFAGNGDGQVINGPFKTGRHWRLVRNAGSFGTLVSKEAIANIISQNVHSQIIGRTARRENNIEFHHNGIHVFVGGLVGSLNTAAKDPLFFMLHCFIDYIWELFRENQIANGINPAEDYPTATPLSHQPNFPMLNFTQYSNIAGYANNWTSEVYTYEKSPECPNCNSKWLRCINGRCISKTRPEQRSSPTSPFAASSIRSDSELQKGSNVQFVEDTQSAFVPSGSCSKLTCPNTDKSVQNTFLMNGVSDETAWKYMPIKVVYERRGGDIFNSFPLKNGKRTQNDDIFNPANSENVRKIAQPGKLGTYQNCKVSGSGATKVYVTADGVSYDGSSLEYTIVDDRLPLSSGYVYLPVRDPAYKPVTIIFTAFDECGRLCRPLCYNEYSYDEPTYVPCSGVLTLDSFGNSTAMYSSSAADAVYSVWNFPSTHDKSKTPTANDSNVCVTFVCDSVPLYPWERAK